MSKIVRTRHVLAGVLGIVILAAGGQDLNPRFRDWLHLVDYIIVPEEREVFSKLSSDRERDTFVEMFWRQRDPTPGTPQNEFREEHLRRFGHAQTHFNRGTAREGWMTDMGRMYIILGEPNSKSDYSGTSGLYDCEVWFYYGDPGKQLPTYFALVFFRKQGSGEYRLYSPVSDGPGMLLENPSPRDFTETRESYQKISALAPTLAPLTLSLIPGETPFNFLPSPRSETFIANILASPRKDVNPVYATHFLDLKGRVSTEYLTNFIGSESLVTVLAQPGQGFPLVHFCLNPSSLTLDYHQESDRYYCSLTLDVGLWDGDKVVYQYSKDYPLYFTAEAAKELGRTGISIQDCFPVVEGSFQLTVLYKNSAGKEFSVLEQEIAVKPSAGAPRIEGPVVGYKLDPHPSDALVAFKLSGERLRPDPKSTLALSEAAALLATVTNVDQALWESGALDIEIRGLRNEGPRLHKARLRLSDFALAPVLAVTWAFPANELTPDYYELRIDLVDGRGQALDSRTANFIVSPKPVPRPVVVAQSLPLRSRHLYRYALAEQNQALGRVEAARANFEEALRLAPGDPEGLVFFGRFLLANHRDDDVLRVVEGIRDIEPFRFDYHALRGRALAGRARYEEALVDLQKANLVYNSDNLVYNSDTDVLNALGLCYLRTNRWNQAEEALRASLRLNPDQPEPKKLLEEITKKTS